ncbi:protein of unknown function [Pedobacter antarcticus]|nr:protein of unknown function [Pedobacter antarcticus]
MRGSLIDTFAMKNKKQSKLIIILLALLVSGINLPAAIRQQPVIIPDAGNSWKKDNSVRIYFNLSKPTKSRISLDIIPDGDAEIVIKAGNKSRTLKLTGNAPQMIDAGTFQFDRSGYSTIELIKKSGNLGIARAVHLNDLPAEVQTNYVKDNQDNRFYWGRRGPSVHLNYDVPETLVKQDISWFYNEITVSEGKDPVGSYFMANGFGEGYFGIQVNSKAERRVLFSIWSPFHTDDPSAIPDDQKILMLRKGKNVQAGEFGDEGSGGQSFLVYPWKAGKKYAFLTSAVPDKATNSTVYTSYFKPADAEWMLIASFRRPQTQTYLTRLHSFLENFDPEMGDQTRKAVYSNQWIRDKSGHWISLSKAKFSGDDIAKRAYRIDYAGGLSKNGFFLQNGGFFSPGVPLNEIFTLPRNAVHPPEIDFSLLR